MLWRVGTFIEHVAVHCHRDQQAGGLPLRPNNADGGLWLTCQHGEQHAEPLSLRRLPNTGQLSNGCLRWAIRSSAVGTPIAVA